MTARRAVAATVLAFMLGCLPVAADAHPHQPCPRSEPIIIYEQGLECQPLPPEVEVVYQGHTAEELAAARAAAYQDGRASMRRDLITGAALVVGVLVLVGVVVWRTMTSSGRR